MQYQSEIEIIKSIVNKTIQNNNKILVCGNGGSASDSNHIVAEFVGKFERKRPPYNALSLTSNVALITAIGNDFGFEHIFSRQIEAIGHEGDVLIAISTSGNSKNVIRGINVAKKKGIYVIVLTGKSGGEMIELGDINICIPSDDTQRIQEGHLMVEHILCEYVEASTV